MIRKEWLIGRKICICLDGVCLHTYTLAAIKKTSPSNGLCWFYDDANELQGVYTRQEMDVLTTRGAISTHLRHINGDFTIEVSNFEELLIEAIKEEGSNARQYLLGVVIPQVQNGERCKEPNRMFAYRVVRSLGDHVGDEELADIANKCGYRVKSFIENYKWFCDRINGQERDYQVEWFQRKARGYWWVRLRELEEQLWRDRVL